MAVSQLDENPDHLFVPDVIKELVYGRGESYSEKKETAIYNKLRELYEGYIEKKATSILCKHLEEN